MRNDEIALLSETSSSSENDEPTTTNTSSFQRSGIRKINNSTNRTVSFSKLFFYLNFKFFCENFYFF